jgi:hypothetical protein
MRWWAGVWAVAGVAVLVACGTSAGGPGPSDRTTSGGAPTRTSAVPTPVPSVSPTGESPSRNPSASATAPPPSTASCVSGRAEVTVGPGDAVVQRLCARPGTVLSLVLKPRADDRRWTAALSSAPVFVLVSGWEVDGDGTARAALRCAGTRGGTAEITVRAKAPDVAGAARVAFTLHVDVRPRTTQG